MSLSCFNRAGSEGIPKKDPRSFPTERKDSHKCSMQLVTIPPQMENSCRDLDEDEIEMLIRRNRKRDADQFRRDYTCGSTLADGCDLEKKTFILSSGTSSWMDKSSGIMWVAVHGLNSICVVTKDEILDVTRVHGFLKCTSEIEVLQCFRTTVVSEIEELANPSSGSLQLFEFNIKKPFGVVSLIPGSDKFQEETGHEVSSVYNDGKTAIEFLAEKFRSDCAFSFNDTVEVAISAFQHLFHRKFKAKEIRVCVLREGRIPCDLRRDLVKERLSAINN